MRRQNIRTFLSLSLLACLFWQAVPAREMQTPAAAAVIQETGEPNGARVINELLRQARGGDYEALLEKIFGDRAAEAADALDEGSEQLIQAVAEGAGRKAEVVSKTVYTEGGAPVTMTTEFDLRAVLTGRVNDEAVLTHYDLQLDAYATNAGHEEALRREVVKEVKLRDGRYGLHYDIPGNTIEDSDGKYGGKRTPAKLGKAEARKLTPMNDADTTLVGSAVGPMVPSIWNSANEMYQSAQRHWRN